MKKKILLIHKKNCLYSKNLIQFLKKKFYLKTTCVANIKSLNKITKNLKFDFIILFRSHLILTKQFIVKNKNIINFHPSTPNYRGVGGINFAIYNKEKYFGSTAHFVNAKIDFGKIIHVKRFKLKLRSDLNNAYNQTLKGMLKQAKYIFNNIEKINLLIKKAKNEKWAYSVIKRKDLENFYKINKNISKNKLKLKIKSTVTKDFKPYIFLHGYKFKFEEK